MDQETELLARMSQGDEDALAELYERLSGNIFSLVLNLLNSREEAEEVVQDTFYKLYNSQGFDTWQRSPRAYIYTIARNEAMSRLRKRKARPQKSDAVDIHDPQVNLKTSEDESDPTTSIWLNRGLSILNKEERSLIEHAYFKGYSHMELAEMVQLPLGTVKSKVRRALIKLKDALNTEDADAN